MKKINDVYTRQVTQMPEYVIRRTRCVQNNLMPGMSIDIDLKLLGMFLTNEDPGNFVASYYHRKTPMLSEHGESTYLRSEGFAYARKHGFEVYKKDIINSVNKAHQIHIVVTDDKDIIKYLKGKDYEWEK